MLLGAPNIFAGAPSTCSEKAIIPMTYFFKKINARLYLSRPACVSASSSCGFLLFFLTTFPLLLPAFSHCCCSRHWRFHLSLLLRGGCGKRFFFFFFVEELATIVAVNRRLPWCIEEAFGKSNATVLRPPLRELCHRPPSR